MARIIIATYMVRYPLGGNLSWALHWALGLHKMGHKVFLVERANYENACFNPRTQIMTNDCATGFAIVSKLLNNYGMEDKLVFQDFVGNFHGKNQHKINDIFHNADLLVDIGNHGAWLEEAQRAGVSTVLVDGEPGYTQMKMEKLLQENQELPNFDYYFSNGANMGMDSCSSPTAGKKWYPVYNPIVVDIFSTKAIPKNAPLSTVMNWQSHPDFNFEGKVYGQKDVEFDKFINLPKVIQTPIEVAVAGNNIPFKHLKKNGWKIVDAHKVTLSVESYYNYIHCSLAEFSICKNAYVSTHTGWFSDRSAAYLANGRPVILQDTGFSDHIPCGRGVFAVNTIEDAVYAVEEITKDYKRQSMWAKEIALNYLDSQIILKKFLKTLHVL